MFDSRLSDRSSSSVHALPRKQEWAIIYEQRAREFERAKSMEKILSQQKKDKFKQQLDIQLMHKYNSKHSQKEEDKKYYEYIMQKAQQMKEKQEKEKFNKFLMSKELQESNRKIMESNQPNNEDYGKVYNIDIGRKSELEKKQRAEAMRRNVIATLDKQRQEKDAELRQRKMQEELENQRNMEYQKSLLHRNGGHKKYEQNQKVYNYYRDIYNQKMRRDKDLEHKFVDSVQQKEAEEAKRRRQRELFDRERKNIEMKDTLEKQLEILQKKKEQQQKVNPEQVSYSFINNIFKDKRPTYNKKEYSLFLDRQSEEQRLNKKSQKYMNQQEYRYNSNQLNKAITGNYTFDRYYDRSMNNIGDRLNISAIEPLKLDDAELLKTKLEVARSHHKSPKHVGDKLQSPFPFGA